MDEQSIGKQALVWIAALLGLSMVWVGVLSLGSVFVVHQMIPEGSPAKGEISGKTATEKPASAVKPTGRKATQPTRTVAPLRRTNG
jgi:hypothetical protein